MNVRRSHGFGHLLMVLRAQLLSKRDCLDASVPHAPINDQDIAPDCSQCFLQHQLSQILRRLVKRVLSRPQSHGSSKVACF